jgi:hypothetical protein
MSIAIAFDDAVLCEIYAVCDSVLANSRVKPGLSEVLIASVYSTSQYNNPGMKFDAYC